MANICNRIKYLHINCIQYILSKDYTYPISYYEMNHKKRIYKQTRNRQEIAQRKLPKRSTSNYTQKMNGAYYNTIYIY